MPGKPLKIFRIHLAMPALVLLLLAGCGVTLQSVERDKELGRQTARKVEADMGIYQDSGKVEYLNRVAGRLVTVHSDKDFTYQFAVVDQYEPNAFALPGGHIYVSRGLLALTNSEDELANVIAHEIVHVSGRHSAKRSAKATVPLLFALPGAIVGGVVNEDLGMLLDGAGSGLRRGVSGIAQPTGRVRIGSAGPADGCRRRL